MASVSSDQIRIVFSDVDGTFADARHQPILESRPVVAMLYSLHHLLEALSVASGFQWFAATDVPHLLGS